MRIFPKLIVFVQSTEARQEMPVHVELLGSGWVQVKYEDGQEVFFPPSSIRKIEV